MAWNKSVDLVVVGSGTGLFAAAYAAHKGLDVMLIEKTAVLGGSTAMSGGGMWMPGNHVSAQAGAPDSLDRAALYLRTIVEGSPEERWQTHLDYSARAVRMIEQISPLKLGPMWEYADYHSDQPGGSATGRSVEPKPIDTNVLGDARPLLRYQGLATPVPMVVTGESFRWMNLMMKRPFKAAPKIAKAVGTGVFGKATNKEYVAGGTALGVGLIKAAVDQGVDLRVNTPLKDLVVEDGRVVGVVAEENGQELRVEARKGVIIAAGGFDHNLQMRRKYQGEALEPGWQFGAEGNTGDTIDIAQKYDVDLALMDKVWWFPAVPPTKAEGGYPRFLLAERSLPGSFIVDQTGRRFFNESTDYMTAGEAMLGIDDGEEPHMPMWMIFDQKFRNSYVFGGELMPGQPIAQEWYDSGVAVKANNIRDMAAKLELPDLVDEFERFNLLAAAGRDDDFERGTTAYDRYYGDMTNTPNHNLRPLQNGTLYAVKVVPGDLGTCGGIKADEHAQAVRTDGSKVDGLYAIGNAAANVFGGVYPGPGATIGQGITLGMAAVDHMYSK